jgi:hypothetical protein
LEVAKILKDKEEMQLAYIKDTTFGYLKNNTLCVCTPNTHCFQDGIIRPLDEHMA